MDSNYEKVVNDLRTHIAEVCKKNKLSLFLVATDGAHAAPMIYGSKGTVVAGLASFIAQAEDARDIIQDSLDAVKNREVSGKVVDSLTDSSEESLDSMLSDLGIEKKEADSYKGILYLSKSPLEMNDDDFDDLLSDIMGDASF